MILERVTPESVGIHSEGILEFIDLAESRGLELHSMMLLRHGKVCAEGWWKPYNPASPHMMFSFTKALTSTAIGFACQEGALSLDDRLSELFPDKMPENPSENLLACTVRDLLTMSCGHETEINTFDVNEPDWIKNFLSHEFKYKPGTCFMYNTAGTNMLCAALKRRTGENLFEYLTPRLFEPLGMENIECFRLPDGIEMGGAGSRLKTEDMARFILFVSRHGKWEGKQLLNAEWFDMASANQVSTISPANNADNPDWRCGYGFQFWRCVPEHVFRADGAFGQYGVVFEDKDTVLILQSSSSDQQEQLTCAWEALLPAITDEPIIWRYFLAPLRSALACRQLDEKAFVAETVMKINTEMPGAFVFSSGKNMGTFKAVGFPEDVGVFYRLEEYEGYAWTAHGRYPTNTPGWWGGAHPFSILDYSVVHNGEISSYDANRRFIEMYGYNCSLLTDTEVITYIIDFPVSYTHLTLPTT